MIAGLVVAERAVGVVSVVAIRVVAAVPVQSLQSHIKSVPMFNVQCSNVQCSMFNFVKL